MKARVKLKAVVFKTNRLQATKTFFETTLGFDIKESSAKHFTIFTRGIRILFLQKAEKKLEVELYATDNPGAVAGKGFFTFLQDPNGIDVIISHHKDEQNHGT